MAPVINQSIKIYIAPFKIPTQRRSRPRPSGKEQSLEAGGTENRHHLEGALDLLEVHPKCLGQPQKMNRSALPQSGRMGPPNYRYIAFIHFYRYISSNSMSLSEALPTTAIYTMSEFTHRSATGNCK